MYMQTPQHVRVMPAGQCRYSYEYPLGRGFVRRARRVGRGVIRFWFRDGVEAGTILVNLRAPWSSQEVDGRAKCCEVRENVAECARSADEEGASCRVRSRPARVKKWMLLVSLDRGSFDVYLMAARRGGVSGVSRDGAGFEVCVFGNVVVGASVLVGRDREG